MKKLIFAFTLLIALNFKSNAFIEYFRYSHNQNLSLYQTDTIRIPNHRNFYKNITDVDGNVYSTVKLGSQIWMGENLKTTKYNDGYPIDYPGDNDTLWNSSSFGSYAWYENNDTVYSHYGALYNWHAVNTRKLCPVGWHVPSNEEWSILEEYLKLNGYNFDKTKELDRFAKSLASPVGWKENKEFAGSIGNDDYPKFRNKSGFSALPGGIRRFDGLFSGINEIGIWWTSTETFGFGSEDSSPQNAYTRDLQNVFYFMRSSDWFKKKFGLSVRCIAD